MTTQHSGYVIPLVTGVACLALGFFGGMEYKAYQIRGVMQVAIQELGGARAALGTPNTTPSAAPTVKEAALGAEIRLATLALKVNGGKTQETTSDGLVTHTPPAGTRMAVVNVTMKNITDAPLRLDASQGFLLTDSVGKQYAAKTDPIAKGMLNYLTLAAGEERTGDMIYEVPVSAEGLSFQVAKGGTNEVYSVKVGN